MKITGLPIQVLWRALDLFTVDRPDTWDAAFKALMSAESRLDVHGDLPPFAQACAEYLSLSGAFAEDGGEFAGVNGYSVQP